MGAHSMPAAPRPSADMLPPVVPDLFQVLDEQAERHGLVGAYCAQCDRYFFPAVGHCPACYGELQRRVFGERGQLYSFTVVRTRAPFALPEPYAVGYVDLEDVPLRVFALLDPAAIPYLAVGSRVVLKSMQLGENALAAPCLRPVYCLSRDVLGGGEPCGA